MGKKKSFTTSALASLTGESQPAEKIAEKVPVAPEPIVQEVALPPTPTVEEAPAVKRSAPTRKPAKKKPSSSLQNPNKRSVKKSHTPVTLYLNATNLEKLKEYADSEEQKISWLIDEMIYDYLSDKLD